MNNISIEKANINDIKIIMKIYEIAKQYMKENGNPTQWDDSYPNIALITEDIKNEHLFVMKLNNVIHGVFVYVVGNDPTYHDIYDGKWMSSDTYGVIHRIATDGKIKHALKSAIDYSRKHLAHLRIDTHRDNKIMNEALIKYGFSYCGKIKVDDGSLRNAYEII